MMFDGGWTPQKVAVFRESFYEFLNCIKISSKEKGEMVLGENLHRAQYMFYDAVFAALENDIHDVYTLKSRHLGISTGTRALTLFWLGMHSNLRGAMVFDTAEHTQTARYEIEEIIDGLPERLHFPKPKKGGRNRNALMLDNNSWLMFTQAGVKNNRS